MAEIVAITLAPTWYFNILAMGGLHDRELLSWLSGGEWPGGAGWWIMALCGGIRIQLAAKHAKTNLIMGTVFRSKLGLISLI